MWMPSYRQSLLAGQPLRDAGAGAVTLDWETIGRAIRECVLDAIEMHVAEGDTESSHRQERGTEQE